MTMRIDCPSLARGTAVTIEVDGHPVTTFLGETIATAILMWRGPEFRVDDRGRPRGIYCNMGTCGECTVDVVTAGGDHSRSRACLMPVAEGLRVFTHSPLPDG